MLEFVPCYDGIALAHLAAGRRVLGLAFRWAGAGAAAGISRVVGCGLAPCSVGRPWGVKRLGAYCYDGIEALCGHVAAWCAVFRRIKTVAWGNKNCRKTRYPRLKASCIGLLHPAGPGPDGARCNVRQFLFTGAWHHLHVSVGPTVFIAWYTAPAMLDRS